MTKQDKTRYRGVVFSAWAAIALVAAPVSAGTLADAVTHGLTRNPEVKSAQARVAIAGSEAKMARNAYLPTVDGSTGPASGGVAYDFTLSQTVYDFGVSGSQVNRAKVAVTREQANLLVVRDDVALEIAEVYLDIASRRVQLGLADAHALRLAALLDTAKIRVEGKYSDKAELARVSLATASTEATIARLRGELADAVEHYRLLVDEPADGVRLPPLPDFLTAVGDDPSLAAAILKSPLYRRADLEVRMAEAGIREAKGARYPRVAVEGTVQRREIGGQLIDDSAIALRLRLNSQRGLSALQRPELEEQRRAAAVQAVEAMRRDIKRVVSSLISQDKALDGRIRALSDQSEFSGAARELYREQFLVGRRDIQDLVLMEGEQFEAERQVAELTIERLRLQYRAAAQLGLLATSFASPDLAKVAQ